MAELRGRRCGTRDLSTGDRARLSGLEQEFAASTGITDADLSAVVPVAFVHIVDGDAGRLDAQHRSRQIQVLNDAFAPLNVRFTHDEDAVKVVDDAQYFRMGHDSLRERTCKTENQMLDPTTGLNFYTARPGGGILGWARFPVELEGDPVMDGVVVRHTSLPGGGGAPFDLGMTAVHEVGHWLGLYHTFQDGCAGLGDEVADTAAHAGPNYGKPSDEGQPFNACSADSVCPIHNFMNYVDDDTMSEFTTGQNQRVWAQLGMFRDKLIVSPAVAGPLDLGPKIVW